MASWTQVKARDLKPGTRIIRNVEAGFEWVPGPYGAFIVQKVKAYDDEFRFVVMEAWGPEKAGAKTFKISYDGDELVTVG